MQRLYRVGFGIKADSNTPLPQTLQDGTDCIRVRDFVANLRRTVLRRVSPHTLVVNGIEIRV